ncbi:MAG: hypothetical protein ACR2GR_10620 [Rhodothermales bacterium]
MENLIWLALLVIYLVLQFVGSKKSPQRPPGQGVPGGQQPGRPSGTRSAPAEGSLEDALREIREALGGRPSPAPTPEPEVETPLEPVSTSVPTRLERRLQKEPTPLQKEPVPAWRERSGFAGEERFERRPALAAPIKVETPLQIAARAPRQGEKTSAKVTLPGDERAVLLGRLRDPQSVRDVIVLSSLLGKPRSRDRRP